MVTQKGQLQRGLLGVAAPSIEIPKKRHPGDVLSLQSFW